MGDTSRVWGALLCTAIVIAGILFIWGISLQSYWAVAVPVIVGFLGVLGLGFWIGWTILTIKTTSPTPETSPPGEAKETSSESQAE